jgi:pimeloyl-ACP methyl ester carboxylesterase
VILRFISPLVVEHDGTAMDWVNDWSSFVARIPTLYWRELFAVLFPLSFSLLVIALDRRSEPTVQNDGYKDQQTFDNSFDGYVIILVHGTWGRGFFCPAGDAPWTVESSTLCHLLRKRLNRRIVFLRFRWSGANTHTARAQAAKDLEIFIKTCLDRWPHAKHFLIAHSHGGNVALCAADPCISTQITGIVCLATPFITARERDFGTDISSLLMTSIEVLGLCFVVFGFISAPYWLKLMFIVAIVLSGKLDIFTGRLTRSLQSRAQSLCHELSPSLPKTNALLIIRSPADEASGFIGIFMILSQVTVRLFIWFQTLEARFEGPYKVYYQIARKRWKLFLVAFLTSIIVVPLFGESLWFLGKFVNKYVLLAGFGLIFLLYIGIGFTTVVGYFLFFMAMLGRIVLEYVFLTISLILLLLMWLPFGWQVALANVYLDVTVDATPVGTWQTHLVNPPISGQPDLPKPPMEHSVHGNPEAIGIIADWILMRDNELGAPLGLDEAKANS